MLTDAFWIQDMPFTPIHAFMYLLGNAVVQTTSVSINGMFVEANQGEIITTVRRLSDDWKWNKNKVSAFLAELNIKDFISLKKESRYTHITVKNYECWIGSKIALRDKLGTNSGRSKQALTHSESIDNTTEIFEVGTNSGRSPQKSPIYILLKSIDNTIELLSKEIDKSEKNSFRNFLIFIAENSPNIFDLKHPFTFEQYLSITKQFSRQEIESIIEDMGNFKPLTKKYLSAYKTFLNWGKLRKAKLATTAFNPKPFSNPDNTPQPPSQDLFKKLLSTQQ